MTQTHLSFFTRSHTKNHLEMYLFHKLKTFSPHIFLLVATFNFTFLCLMCYFPFFPQGINIISMSSSTSHHMRSVCKWPERLHLCSSHSTQTCSVITVEEISSQAFSEVPVRPRYRVISNFQCLSFLNLQCLCFFPQLTLIPGLSVEIGTGSNLL